MTHLSLMQEAWVSIAASRLRTFLAMLGIIIGVGSVVLMLAVGAGSQRAVEETIAKLGTNLLVITPGATENKGLRSMAVSSLTIKDAEAIADLPSVSAAAPSTYGRSFQLAAGKLNWNTQLSGTTPAFFPIRNWQIAEGEAFTDDDTRLARHVIVIGPTVAGKLFPHEIQGSNGILGRSVTINGSSFQVVGVLDSKGSGLDGRDQDDAAFIPITTARSRLWGQNAASSIVQFILVQAASSEEIDAAAGEITSLLRQRNRLKDSAGNNFAIRNPLALMQVATDTTQALSLLLGAIASVSLVVGGIGIMNIMLVTVTERTREIGIRKAIGASERQILLQFLAEAVIIAAVGSLVGLVSGFGLGLMAEAWFGVSVDHSLWSVVLALAVAVVVGIASGIYPAWKAAKLQPIDALRAPG